jgi:hypothetical protein
MLNVCGGLMQFGQAIAGDIQEMASSPFLSTKDSRRSAGPLGLFAPRSQAEIMPFVTFR